MGKPNWLAGWFRAIGIGLGACGKNSVVPTKRISERKPTVAGREDFRSEGLAEIIELKRRLKETHPGVNTAAIHEFARRKLEELGEQ